MRQYDMYLTNLIATGIYTLPDGSMFEGNYINGKEEGYGLCITKDGAKTVHEFHIGELLSTNDGKYLHGFVL